MRRLLPVLALSALIAGSATLAQVDGDGRGVAPVDSGSSFEVAGVTVDVTGKTAEAARYGGWRLAQRKAWVQLSRRLGGSGTLLSDGALDQLVSGIVVENEQIGPTRYIARLGVLFDRGRAAGLLGISAYADRSPPMLVLPVIWQGGAGQVFERRTPWQEAWARFRTGDSRIDYVRPAGTGPDSLLLNAGQVGRPGRGWWRAILDQYGASDLLMPTARLSRQWPGGPVIGVFEARHGPDNDLLGRVTLRVGSAAGLPQLMDAGVARLDSIYQAALANGRLRPDASLSPPPAPAPEPAPVAEPTIDTLLADIAASNAVAVTVQYDTPGTSSVANSEALIRSLPGVRSASTTSLALGGVSLMRVFVDDPVAFATALRSRGYEVSGSGATLRIRRPAAPAPATTPSATGPG